MESLTWLRVRKHEPPEEIYDLTAARQYLHRLERTLHEAAFSSDPRVLWLGVQLARFQGAEGR